MTCTLAAIVYALINVAVTIGCVRRECEDRRTGKMQTFGADFWFVFVMALVAGGPLYLIYSLVMWRQRR